MKTIILMFDSLQKSMLSAYGNNEVITPNFMRLKQHSVMFDQCYVGSMPCMPARRDLQCGRLNFLHRSWGPMEPWDNSSPELLKKHGIYSHMITDHKHYWRDGGSNYHTKFHSYEFVRGQEGDAWKGDIKRENVVSSLGEPPTMEKYKATSRNQDVVNRKYMKSEEDHPMYRTVQGGLEFIDTNHLEDDFFLQIECFDPHEPFFVPQKYLDMYGMNEEFNGWPPYYFDNLDGSLSNKIKIYYKALITMCDAYVGKVLDKMDEYNLWEDTMFILTTDHGLLLGEHAWWGKNIMPMYNEIANIPFFLYDPVTKKQNEVCHEVIQNIDVAATLLDFYQIEKPEEMLGTSILPMLKGEHGRGYAFFGYHGSNINISDGRYVYMRSPIHKEVEAFEYTLMPAHMSSPFSVSELSTLELHPAFDFTKGLSMLKIPCGRSMQSNANRFGKRLYDIQSDPLQLHPIHDEAVELRLVKQMQRIMQENDAPSEVYKIYGLEANVEIEQLRDEQLHYRTYCDGSLALISFADDSVKEGYLAFLAYLNPSQQEKMNEKVRKQSVLDAVHLHDIIKKEIPLEHQNEVFYQVNLQMRLD